jgi:radical SAM superfamily enzyme YgiQ (UPF0313 family)
VKLLLLYPPEQNLIDTELPKVLEQGIGIVPPLGLLYIAASVQHHTNWDVEVIDSLAEKLDYAQIEERIRASQPDAVGVTVMTHILIDCLKVADIAKKVDSNIRVIFGGPHVHLYPEESIAFDCVDYVVVGEGEYTIVELLKSWNKPCELQGICGLYFKAEGRAVTANPLHKAIEDLDSVIHPARQLLKSGLYFSSMSRHPMLTTMITSRGCPYKCVFCDRPNLGKRFRARSSEDVADEMEECVKLGIREIVLYDDTFTIDRNRVFSVCREIERRGIRISWSIRARVDRIDLDMLKALKSAGCERINYGVESGSDKVLKNLHKGITKEQAVGAFGLTKKVGIQTVAYFMFGCPGETRDQMSETMEFAKQLNPDYCHFTILVPFPGTPLYAEGTTSGALTHDYWREFAQNPTSDFKPELWIEQVSRRELEDVLMQAYKEFYMRPSYLFRSLIQLRSLGEFKRKLQAGLHMLRST